MLSSLLSHFGAKRKPSFTPPTIERTHWYVSQPLHAAKFEDKAWGLAWCKQHGFPENVLQEQTVKLNEEDYIAKANALDNMFDLIKKGHMTSMPTIAPDTPATHLDKFFDSFKAQPQISAGPQLLNMAFSVNRVEVAQYLGNLLEKSFAHWDAPLEIVSYQDPSIVHNANASFLEGFKDLMFKPRQMQWLMEHNPNLLEKIKVPATLAKLESSIFNFASPAHTVMWPLLAKTVFDYYADPTGSHLPINALNPGRFNSLMLSFFHDPAAQCTLIYQARRMPWFSEHESMTVSLKNASPFVAPEAIAFRQHLQKDHRSTNDADLDTKVSLLTMILDNSTKTEEFYQHALAVLSPVPQIEMALPELDSSDHVAPFQCMVK